MLLTICGILFFKAFITMKDIDSKGIEIREKYSGLPKAPDQQKVSSAYLFNA